jgi:hypothetical protein
MSSAAAFTSDAVPGPPPAVRACLTPTLAAEFDHEWEIILDRVMHVVHEHRAQ